MHQYQTDFIKFLVQTGALTFGEFVTKSGRQTPYFVNSGNFNTGERIARIGEFYAQHLIAQKMFPLDTLFGPAYKGVPLAVSTASALYSNHSINCGYSFNRKEAKAHGDKGKVVGLQINDGCKIVIVEDVITAGTTLLEIVPQLREMAKVELLGVIVAVDRQERATGTRSALQDIQQSLSLKISPIVTISEILEFLSSQSAAEYKLSEDKCEAIKKYLELYGA